MIIAFDIDGTIANNDHREHLAHKGSWDEFHSLCHLDKPIPETVSVLRALYAEGHSIELWTARTDAWRPQTVDWLKRHSIQCDALLMRAKDDRRKAFIVKLEWYLQREPSSRPSLIFEDHPQTVYVLREAGACVYQVAEGKQKHETELSYLTYLGAK